jgi:hypothetical protein
VGGSAGPCTREDSQPLSSPHASPILAPSLTPCTLHAHTHTHTCMLQDATGSFSDNQVAGNARGAFVVVPSLDLDLDLDSLRALNRLAGQVLVKG